MRTLEGIIPLLFTPSREELLLDYILLEGRLHVLLLALTHANLEIGWPVLQMNSASPHRQLLVPLFNTSALPNPWGYHRRISWQQVGERQSDLKNDFKNRGFPFGSAGKESTCNVGDLGLIPGLGRSSPGEGKGYPLQYSGPENSMDCIVHGGAK